jgi:hypothetical protein
MPHLWDVDAIVQPHHFVLVEMCMLDTLLQCVLRMAICAHFGLLEWWALEAIVGYFLLKAKTQVQHLLLGLSKNELQSGISRKEFQLEWR